MVDLDRNAILDQMGITQWVLRDLPADEEIELKEKPTPKKQLASTENVAKSKPTAPVFAANYGADKLDALSNAFQNCTLCGLSNVRNKILFGAGSEQADWLFIGESPSAQEEQQGKPFVGRAGQLFTQILRALGLDRESVYLSHIVKCRTAENSQASTSEIQSCAPLLLKQIALIQPKVIVALGEKSAQALLGSDLPLDKLRAKSHAFGGDKTPLIVSHTPGHLLRNPADKKQTWQDLLLHINNCNQR